MRQLRALLFTIRLYTSMVFFGGALFVPSLFWRKPIHWAIRYWSATAIWGLRWIVGARLRIEGREHLPKGPGLVAGKHQSMLDTLAPNVLLDDAVFVFKEELLAMPVFGWYIRRAGMVPVARHEAATALKSMLRAAKRAIADGRQIVIFPEGTRKNFQDPPDYKSGIAALYMSLKLPCTPMALNTGLVWPPRGFDKFPGEVVIKFLPPIPPGLARAEFMHELESRIEKECQAMLPKHLRRSESRAEGRTNT